MGLLRKGFTEGIAGMMLDHDLDEQAITETDRSISATRLSPAIAATIPRHVPILIHSMNTSKPTHMKKFLEAQGFSVTRIRYAALQKVDFDQWLDDVRDNFEEQ